MIECNTAIPIHTADLPDLIGIKILNEINDNCFIKKCDCEIKSEVKMEVKGQFKLAKKRKGFSVGKDVVEE